MRKLETSEKELFEYIVNNLKPQRIRGPYLEYQVQRNGKRMRFKRSRINYMLNHNVFLEKYEIVHHKDGNKQNDAIENLEVIDTFNFNVHTSNHHAGLNKPGSGNHECKTKQEVIDRAKEIAAEMTRLNCSEIARRLENEGMKISSAILKKYLKNEFLQIPKKTVEKKTKINKSYIENWY